MQMDVVEYCTISPTIIIRLCLSLWIKSPKVYEELRHSGVLVLPSGRLLSLYKNSVKQRPGLNEEVLEWMLVEANKLGLDSFGREGGLILDEMAIQVCLYQKGAKVLLTT